MTENETCNEAENAGDKVSAVAGIRTRYPLEIAIHAIGHRDMPPLGTSAVLCGNHPSQSTHAVASNQTLHSTFSNSNLPN